MMSFIHPVSIRSQISNVFLNVLGNVLGNLPPYHHPPLPNPFTINLIRLFIESVPWLNAQKFTECFSPKIQFALWLKDNSVWLFSLSPFFSLITEKEILFFLLLCLSLFSLLLNVLIKILNNYFVSLSFSIFMVQENDNFFMYLIFYSKNSSILLC